MKLIIDIGNTLTKSAVFEGKELIYLSVHKELSIEIVSSIEEKHPKINSAIVSSVSPFDSSVKDYLKEKFFFIELSHSTKLPIKSIYKTPETLGNDRIAAVTAAFELYPKTNVLVIDAGTCITYDIINEHGVYSGGSISPGIEMRFKALNSFTARLPLLNYKEIDYLSGLSTEQSILSGVINGLNAEIDGIIESYQKNYEYLTVILSGGDYIYFDKRLKNNIFALPNIVLQGLNVILDFNGKKLD